MKTVWIGALGIALLGSAEAGWALPAAPPPVPAVAEPSSPLLLIRHHRHHHHPRHSRSRSLREPAPEAAAPGTVREPPDGSEMSGSDRPAASTSAPTSTEPAQPALNRAGRHSGSSKPAIRWVDPEKSGR
jgi:hypothetical protein